MSINQVIPIIIAYMFWNELVAHSAKLLAQRYIPNGKYRHLGDLILVICVVCILVFTFCSPHCLPTSKKLKEKNLRKLGQESTLVKLSTEWPAFSCYIARLVLHVWCMVTENNVRRMILKSWVWRLISKRYVWLVSGGRQTQCFEITRQMQYFKIRSQAQHFKIFCQTQYSAPMHQTCIMSGTV